MMLNPLTEIGGRMLMAVVVSRSKRVMNFKSPGKRHERQKHEHDTKRERASCVPGRVYVSPT
jgi:hypothetical protein